MSQNLFKTTYFSSTTFFLQLSCTETKLYFERKFCISIIAIQSLVNDALNIQHISDEIFK
jgi:hypothetical protein